MLLKNRLQSLPVNTRALIRNDKTGPIQQQPGINVLKTTHSADARQHLATCECLDLNRGHTRVPVSSFINNPNNREMGWVVLKKLSISNFYKCRKYKKKIFKTEIRLYKAEVIKTGYIYKTEVRTRLLISPGLYMLYKEKLVLEAGVNPEQKLVYRQLQSPTSNRKMQDQLFCATIPHKTATLASATKTYV